MRPACAWPPAKRAKKTEKKTCIFHAMQVPFQHPDIVGDHAPALLTKPAFPAQTEVRG